MSLSRLLLSLHEVLSIDGVGKFDASLLQGGEALLFADEFDESGYMKIKVVAIAKDEAAYLPEWCFHHLYFGFDACEVWLNNITDNSVAVCNALEAQTQNRFSWMMADELLSSCNRKGKNFQTEAYNAAFGQARRQGFSHVLFIDLDELWTPQDFQSSIYEYLARKELLQADVVAFNWAIDTPHYLRPAYARPFSDLMWVHNNRHVKSLVSTSAKVERINIHAARVKNSDSYYLADGRPFILLDDDQHERSLLSKQQFEVREKRLAGAFIYHRIYRSQHEYLSSLDKGRRHASNDARPLKLNRLGYRPDPKSTKAKRYNIDQQHINAYEAAWSSFMTPDLLSLQAASRVFVTHRYEALLVKLEDNNCQLFVRYQGLFHSVTDQGIQRLHRKLNWGPKPASINYVIVTSISLPNDKIVLEGYGFNIHTRKVISEATIISSSGRKYPLSVSSVPPNLTGETFDRAPESCGFISHSDMKWEGEIESFSVTIGGHDYMVPLEMLPSIPDIEEN